MATSTPLPASRSASAPPRKPDVRALMGFLLGNGPWPDAETIELARRHWLGPWLSLRLSEPTPHPSESTPHPAHPTSHPSAPTLPPAEPSVAPPPAPPGEWRSKIAADFASSFLRRAAIEMAWSRAHAAFATKGIACITLGCLPYADQLYAHPAQKFSQDIDLLIRPADLGAAESALAAAGFHRVRGHGMWRWTGTDGGEGVELDLHTTPGEEARNPVLARVYGQTTAQLFDSAEEWRGFGAADGKGVGALRLVLPSLADNRVIHFFKHHCNPLRHGVELALLLAMEMDRAALAAAVSRSRSGRVWAFVLAVLREWGCDGLGGKSLVDPTSPEDRAWVEQRAVRRLVLRAAALEDAPLRILAELRMVGVADRIRYVVGVAWPPRRVLLEMNGRADDDARGVGGAALVTRLRLARLGRVLVRGLRGR